MLKIAVFDLDQTLSVRHMWNELGYHRRGLSDLLSMSRMTWIQEQGGPEEFLPEKLTGLFRDLRDDGFELGLATYNKRHVAEAFLEVFEFRQFFREDYIMSRDDGGPKSEHWIRILQASPAERFRDIQGVYYDDSLTECLELKKLLPHFQIHHVQKSLASPAAHTREIKG